MEHDQAGQPPDDDSGQLAETKMRRALGIGAQKTDRTAQHSTPGNMQRRRFVTDGEVPVVMIRGRRDHPPSDGGASVNERLSTAETALHAERDARLRAEAALADARHLIQNLQTQVAHADMARADAVAQAQRAIAEAAAATQAMERMTDEQAQAEAAHAALHAAAHASLPPPAPVARHAAPALKAPEPPVREPQAREQHAYAPQPQAPQPHAPVAREPYVRVRPRYDVQPVCAAQGMEVPAFTAQIVTAYLQRNPVAPAELPVLAENVMQALATIDPSRDPSRRSGRDG